MRRRPLASRDNAAHRAQVLAEIGRRLRAEFDTAQALPDGLAELVKKIEHPGSCTRVELKPAR